MSIGATTTDVRVRPSIEVGRPRTLDDVIEGGTQRLLELQRPGGWWAGELEANVTITAEHLFFLEFLRLRDAETTAGVRAELLARQGPDGLWSIYEGGEPDINATTEAYAALRLAGVPSDASELARAREFCLERGGIGATRALTRIWLSLIGLWSWDEVPQLPAELALLPPSAPISVYSFACWARQTIVALAVVMHYRPVRALPDELAARELDLGPRDASTRTVWDGIDGFLKRYAHVPVKPGRERALEVAEQWIIDRQELDGSWGGIQPPWVWSVVALVCRGHGPESPYVEKAVRGWDRFLVDEGERRRPEACQSPVWDTALAVLALRAAGVPASDPGLERAGAWLLDEEVLARGDWGVRLPAAAPGGWSFEYDNDIYPDVDDAAVVGLALEELGVGDAAVTRACDWIVAMQSANGGWGAFDVDNDSEWLYEIPFCDLGAVIDPPSVDVSAHAIELLARKPGYEPALERGLAYLLDEQERDGSWFGRWGVNYVYGTGAALPALESMGYRGSEPPVQRAIDWLATRQNPDGGFGEDCRSYDTGEAGVDWRGRGESTPSQTAWALMALVSAGAANTRMARRAADWLCLVQRDDGDWDETAFTGTGFPGDFLIRYHLYRIVWPMIALGRYRTALAGA